MIIVDFLRDWLLTVLIEGAVLWFALEPRYPTRLKLHAAWWLSTCTLPLVHFVFPLAADLGAPRWLWLTGAEIFAPLAECLLFRALVTHDTRGVRRATVRDMLAIVLANLASFGAGVWLATIGVR